MGPEPAVPDRRMQFPAWRGVGLVQNVALEPGPRLNTINLTTETHPRANSLIQTEFFDLISESLFRRCIRRPGKLPVATFALDR